MHFIIYIKLNHLRYRRTMTPPFQLSSHTLSSQPNHANDLWKGLKGIHRPILQGLNDRFILRTFHSLHYIIFRYLWPNY
jgi:hypothetical protein